MIRVCEVYVCLCVCIGCCRIILGGFQCVYMYACVCEYLCACMYIDMLPALVCNQNDFLDWKIPDLR